MVAYLLNDLYVITEYRRIILCNIILYNEENIAWCVLADHVVRLKAVYSELSIRFNAVRAASWMFQHSALTLKELQSIQSLRDRPIEAAETLLNLVIDQPRAVFDSFLDALKHSNQQHVYQWLVYDVDNTGEIDLFLYSNSLWLQGLGIETVAFLPARRFASAGLCDSNVSVRLSVTHWYCVKTKKADIMISSPSGSPTILVF